MTYVFICFPKNIKKFEKISISCGNQLICLILKYTKGNHFYPYSWGWNTYEKYYKTNKNCYCRVKNVKINFKKIKLLYYSDIETLYLLFSWNNSILAIKKTLKNQQDPYWSVMPLRSSLLKYTPQETFSVNFDSFTILLEFIGVYWIEESISSLHANDWHLFSPSRDFVWLAGVGVT